LAGIPLWERLVKFEYTESLKKNDEKVTLVLDNPDGELTQLNRIALGVSLRLTWGYPTLESPVRTLVVRKIKGLVSKSGGHMVPAASGGSATVTYEARGKIVDLNTILARTGTRVFLNMKVSDVVREVAKRNGFEGDNVYIEDTGEILEMVAMKVGESEAHFLHRLANLESNFAFSISDRGFHFGPEGTGPLFEQITFFEGPDVLSWEVEGDFTLPVPTTSTPRGLFGFEGASAYGPPVTGATTLVEFAGRRDAEVVRTLDERFEEFLAPPSRSASKAAIRRMEQAAFATWKIKLTVVGNPRLFVRMGVNLINFGPLVDGPWFIKEVTHTIDENGYVTVILLRRKGFGPGADRALVGFVAPGPTGAAETRAATLVEFPPQKARKI
jgi:phage protein D